MTADVPTVTPRLLYLLIPPGAQSLDITGPLDVFLEANRQWQALQSAAEPAPYQVMLVAMQTSRDVMAGGLRLLADLAYSEVTQAPDTLLVAGSPDAPLWESHSTEAERQAIGDWLRRMAPECRRLGSVCTGAFYLASAGLFDGLQVTTHWQHAEQLAERYPQLRVEADAIYCSQQGRYSCAGVTAGIDLALALVEEDLGKALALKVARRLVVFLKRPGGQSQFSAALAAQYAEDSRIAAVQQWALSHLQEDLSVVALAGRAAMSVRNFTRLFRQTTGQTVASFVLTIRLQAARQWLEQSALPLQRVADRSGFAHPDIMRKAFLRALGVTPSEYRRRFQG